jgi:leader peptidase (prepilin peptidase)/N-methyltransferase
MQQLVLFGFLLGLLFGSFLNVCISRIPAHRSIVTPRSHCNSCGNLICWYDNIPILSWIALSAHCRHCDAPIPWRYPAVELAVGLWFAKASAQMWAHWNLNAISQDDVIYSLKMSAFYSVDVIGFAVLGFLLIGLMVMDWQTLRLPDAFTVTGIAVGFALACVQAIFHEPEANPSLLILRRFASIAAAALILLVIRWSYQALRKQEGMGLGDVKMLAMIAAFLGLSQTLVALFATVIAASLYGIGQLARRRAHASSRLPFGSFLAAGGLLAALFGSPIVTWYMAFLR